MCQKFRFDTTSSTLSLVAHFLASNLKSQQDAQEEIDALIGSSVKFIVFSANF